MSRYMFSLELPHRGHSNEYTHHMIFNKKYHPKLSQSAAKEFFPRDSRKKLKQPW